MVTRSIRQIAALVVPLASIFAVSSLLQFGVHLHHDVAWVVHSAGWLLEGKTFGEDIVASNPPLIWYLSVPAALASRLLSIAEPTSFRCYWYVVSTLLLGLTWSALRPLRSAGQAPVAGAMLLTLAYCTLIAVGRNFGQREVLTTMLVLPYLLVVAGRLSGERPVTWLAVLSGALAGIGFSMKPYFLLAPVFVEACYVLKQGTPRSLFRPESLALACCVGLYVALIFLVTPAYVFTVVPMVQSIYWAFAVDSVGVLSRFLPWSLLLCLTLAILPLSHKAIRPYLVTMSLAGGGFAAAYLIQWKGYAYHAFPLSTLLLMVVVMVISSALQSVGNLAASRPAMVHAYRIGLTTVLAMVLLPQMREVALWYRVARIRDGAYGKQTQRLIDFADEHAAGGTIYAFSTNPYPGFPTATHSRARWGSRMNSQFIIPAVVKSQQRPSFRASEGLREAIAFQRRVVVEDFLENRPAVVFVDNRELRHAIETADFDFLAFFTSDREFAAIWKGYREVKPIGAIRVFVREVSPAANPSANQVGVSLSDTAKLLHGGDAQ
jgi:hypothetical protein